MKKGFTLVELLLTIIAIVIATALILPSFSAVQTTSSPETPCKANLDQIGKIMKVYLLDMGRNVLFPQADGEEFLVTLYHAGLLAEPTAFLCPTTPDINNNGLDLAKVSGPGDTDGPCSYAGRKNAAQQNYPGIFKPQKDTTTTPLAADDWNDGVDENHEKGEILLFLFVDGHSERVRSPGANFAKDYAALYDPLTN